MKNNGLLIASILLVVVILIWYGRKTCMLGRYSSPECLRAANGSLMPVKNSFCGGMPAPGAMSEAMGLYEMGVRPEHFCGSVAAPGAMAEYEGLRQMGWRPEHFSRRPCGYGPHPAAIAEAQALQNVGALNPNAPYYTKSAFTSHGAPGMHTMLGEAASDEEHMLYHLQALSPGDPSASDPYPTHPYFMSPEPAGMASPNGPTDYESAGMEMDAIASQIGRRQNAAYKQMRDKKTALRSAPGQIRADHALHTSMREGFGGPDEAGFGWSPSEADVVASPSTGGWGPAM